MLKTPEKELSPPPSSDLNLTPVLGEGREEPPSSPSTPVAAEETGATPVATSLICDLPLKCKGGAKCFEIWSREHGLTKCGKSFKNENDLKMHAQNNHNYCLEHERMWYKCLPCKLREQDDDLLAPQSGALRISAPGDSHPIPLIAFEHLSLSIVI